MIKKVLFSITVMTLSLVMILPACIAGNGIVANAARIETATTYGSSYTWYYKEVDGKKYMRLWDETNHRWVTDWILVS